MRVGIIGVSMRAEFRDNLTNAIRYWELKRVVYNLVLAAIVIVQFCLQWPGFEGAPAVRLYSRTDDSGALSESCLLRSLCCRRDRPVFRTQGDMAALSLGSVYDWSSFCCHADLFLFQRSFGLGLQES